MGKSIKRTHRGFTLIELVIVITILAILAAVAIPAFQNLTGRARDAGVQGALGGLRSAIAIYRASELADGRAGSYPSLNQMLDVADNTTTPKAMENGDTPDNPWCGSAGGGTHCGGNRDNLTSGGTSTRAIDTAVAAGWRYDSASGLVYANTSASTGGVAENTF
ncbi:MAG: type II secretion system protein [Candidatus Omnitrophota bacterium]